MYGFEHIGQKIKGVRICAPFPKTKSTLAVLFLFMNRHFEPARAIKYAKSIENLYNTKSDVDKKQWFYKAINYCVNKKIFVEKNGEFTPDACITRGEFCRIINAYINGHCDMKKISKKLQKINCNNMPFIDVLKGEKIYEDILICYALDIINGVDDIHFMPNGLLSRAHLCQMIYKLIKIIEDIEG